MAPAIEYRKFEDVNLDGGTVVDGIPSVGLVSTIVANYLIDVMDLDHVGAFESVMFPPTSMVHDTLPKLPVRVYASEEHNCAVVLAEFTPPAEQARPIAQAIIEFAQNNGCGRIISPEGIPYTEFDETVEDADVREPRVFSVGSTANARLELGNLEIPQLASGMITGVGGVLLNEGMWRHVDVIAILAEAREKVPDARSAAKIIEVIDRFFPHIRVEAEPLYEQAEQIETRLKKARAQAQKGIPPETPDMYR